MDWCEWPVLPRPVETKLWACEYRRTFQIPPNWPIFKFKSACRYWKFLLTFWRKWNFNHRTSYKLRVKGMVWSSIPCILLHWKRTTLPSLTVFISWVTFLPHYKAQWISLVVRRAMNGGRFVTWFYPMAGIWKTTIIVWTNVIPLWDFIPSIF